MGICKETCQCVPAPWSTGNEYHLPVPVRSPNNITVKAKKEAVNYGLISAKARAAY